MKAPLVLSTPHHSPGIQAGASDAASGSPRRAFLSRRSSLLPLPLTVRAGQYRGSTAAAANAAGGCVRTGLGHLSVGDFVSWGELGLRGHVRRRCCSRRRCHCCCRCQRLRCHSCRCCCSGGHFRLPGSRRLDGSRPANLSRPNPNLYAAAISDATSLWTPKPHPQHVRAD